MSHAEIGRLAPKPFSYDGASSQASAMSLRDYFAAQAMASILGKTPLRDSSLEGLPAAEKFSEVLASSAYAIADAMLAEREK